MEFDSITVQRWRISLQTPSFHNINPSPPTPLSQLASPKAMSHRRLCTAPGSLVPHFSASTNTLLKQPITQKRKFCIQYSPLYHSVYTSNQLDSVYLFRTLQQRDILNFHCFLTSLFLPTSATVRVVVEASFPGSPRVLDPGFATTKPPLSFLAVHMVPVDPLTKTGSAASRPRFVQVLQWRQMYPRGIIPRFVLPLLFQELSREREPDAKPTLFANLFAWALTKVRS